MPLKARTGTLVRMIAATTILVISGAMLLAAGGRADGAVRLPGYRLVQVEAYGDLRRVAELPEEDCPGLAISLAQNEYEAVCLAIGNQEPEAKTLTARVLIEKPADGAELLAQLISLRQAAFVSVRPGRANIWVIELPYKPPVSDEVIDPLLPLGPAPLITVPAGETAYLWVTVHAADLAPGEYQANLSIRPLGRQPAKTVPLRVTVWPFAIPDKMPLTVFCWDSNLARHDGAEMGKQYLEMLTSHGVNAFHIRGMPRPPCDAQGNPDKVDFAKHLGALLDLEQGHGSFVIEIHHWACGKDLHVRGGASIPFMSEGYQKAVRAYILELVAYLQQRGIGYDQWCLYPWDESLHPRFRRLAKFIKRVDPQVRIWSDSTGESLEEVQAIAPYMDVWCPLYRTCERYPDQWEFMKATGKPMWNYFCGWKMKNAPPVYYRQPGWLAWRDGLQGVTFWTACAYASDQWDDFDSDHPDTSVIYPLPNGVASSRRWEAFRDGLEDYCYMWTLHNLAKGDDQSQVDALLDTAATELLAAADAETTESWRQTLVKQIIIRLAQLSSERKHNHHGG